MPWQLDQARSKLEFSVRHMVVSTVRGTFSDFSATLDIDESDLTKSRVSAQIATKSVNTGDRLRDEFLTSNGFFCPLEHPYITFESTSTKVRGSDISVTGKFKIRAVERQLTLDGKVKGPTTSSDARRWSFALTAEIDREAYDLTFHQAVETVSLVVGKKVTLKLALELVEA